MLNPEQENTLKELWQEYRYAKAWGSMSQLMLELVFFKQSRFDFFEIFPPEQNPETSYEGVVKAGSLYYITEIDPPNWFRRAMLQDLMVYDNPISVLKKTKLNKLVKLTRIKKKGRKK